MNNELLQTLQTPCMVIDMQKAHANIMAMQKVANEAHCVLRPHIKTHKMVRFAKMQIDAGAVGITCAKLSEAEIMADGGIEDIFVAYPIIGVKTERAALLAKRVKRLILAVDSPAGAVGLSDAAVRHHITFEVRLEVDTGAKRTGVQTGMVALATQIAALPGLSLTGVYTFKSLVYQNNPTTDFSLAAQEEGELMQAIAKELSAAGFENLEISAGSSPTGASVAKTGMVSEIRPGTYIFKDYMLHCEGVAALADVAVRLFATVVSTPCKEYAVLDGGTKTFPTDIMLNQPPYQYASYAMVQDNDDLRLLRMNEEHGILTSVKGDTQLAVGDIIELMPVHVCTALNMQNNVYLYENNILTLVPVDARGALT